MPARLLETMLASAESVGGVARSRARMSLHELGILFVVGAATGLAGSAFEESGPRCGIGPGCESGRCMHGLSFAAGNRLGLAAPLGVRGN